MDRDSLFIGSSPFEWPGTLLLWLVGLAIQPIINRAYRPTDNAMIERAHQTWCSDVLEGRPFGDVDALQTASDQALEDRRLQLPSRHPGCDSRAPAVAFPDLLCARHPYQVDHERQLFDIACVDAYLAQWEWRRQIDSAQHGRAEGLLVTIGSPATRVQISAGRGYTPRGDLIEVPTLIQGSTAR